LSSTYFSKKRGGDWKDRHREISKRFKTGKKEK